MSDTMNLGEVYYQALQNKDIDAVGRLIHDDVVLSGPMMDDLHGREAFLEGCKQWFSMLIKIVSHEQFAAGDQAVFIKEVHYPEPIGMVRTADMMTFRDGLLIKAELFYDASPMAAMKGKDE